MIFFLITGRGGAVRWETGNFEQRPVDCLQLSMNLKEHEINAILIHCFESSNADETQRKCKSMQNKMFLFKAWINIWNACGD